MYDEALHLNRRLSAVYGPFIAFDSSVSVFDSAGERSNGLIQLLLAFKIAKSYDPEEPSVTSVLTLLKHICPISHRFTS